MFSYLKGTIAEKEGNTLVIEVSGVGFLCTVSSMTLASLPQEGETATVYTHLAVREDALDLFGFASREEMQNFKLLTSVSGVGPKAAIAILSQFSGSEFSLAVATEDWKAITRAQGVGPKLAQRIVLELKEKITSVEHSVNTALTNSVPISNKDNEAIEALTSLGFTAGDAKNAVRSLNTKDMSVEDIIRIALKSM